MNLTINQLNALLGRKVRFNTLCVLDDEPVQNNITGEVLGFTIYHKQNAELVINSDEFGKNHFNTNDIVQLTLLGQFPNPTS